MELSRDEQSGETAKQPVAPHNIPSHPIQQMRRPTVTWSHTLHEQHQGWLLGLPTKLRKPLESETPITIAVGGGKGGVGKSLLCANLAARIARAGFRVLAVDLDYGGANLHTYFGMNPAKPGMSDYLNCTESKNIGDYISASPWTNLWLMHCGREDAWSVSEQLDRGGMEHLWEGFYHLKSSGQIDVVVLDLGAGSHRHTIDFFCTSHMGIVTVLPEPTSIENAYLFLKTYLFRLISNMGSNLNDVETAEKFLKYLRNQETLADRTKSYVDKIQDLSGEFQEFADQIKRTLQGRRVGFVTNQIRSQTEIDIGKSMDIICGKYFGLASVFLNFLNYDEAAWKSLRNKKLLIADFPQSILARRVSEIAAQIFRAIGF